jgi:hypothetical protein
VSAKLQGGKVGIKVKAFQEINRTLTLLQTAYPSDTDEALYVSTIKDQRVIRISNETRRLIFFSSERTFREPSYAGYPDWKESREAQAAWQALAV